MSKIALSGSPTGTGVFTIESPSSNTSRTLTLPDEAGTVLTTTSGVAKTGDTMTGNLIINNGRLSIGQTAGDVALFGKDTGGNAFVDANIAGADFGVYTQAAGGGGSQRRLRVDADGRVTMPYQPAFKCRGSGGSYALPAGKITAISLLEYDRGSNYSVADHRFTAPVTGVYYFYVNLFGVGGSDRIGHAVNGSNNTAPYLMHVRDNVESGSISLKLNAGDYVELFAQYSGSTIYLDHSGWGGFLIG